MTLQPIPGQGAFSLAAVHGVATKNGLALLVI